MRRSAAPLLHSIQLNDVPSAHVHGAAFAHGRAIDPAQQLCKHLLGCAACTKQQIRCVLR